MSVRQLNTTHAKEIPVRQNGESSPCRLGSTSTGRQPPPTRPGSRSCGAVSSTSTHTCRPSPIRPFWPLSWNGSECTTTPCSFTRRSVTSPPTTNTTAAGRPSVLPAGSGWTEPTANADCGTEPTGAVHDLDSTDQQHQPSATHRSGQNEPEICCKESETPQFRPRRGRTPPASRNQAKPRQRCVPTNAAASFVNSPRWIASQNGSITSGTVTVNRVIATTPIRSVLRSLRDLQIGYRDTDSDNQVLHLRPCPTTTSGSAF
jgi:hypothetical protein